MKPIYFAGIGSRETPEDVAVKQKEVGKILAKLGVILRTGGADGSDTNFEEAYTEAKVTKETGGTGTAIRLASRCKIPIINMFNDDWEKQLNDVLVSLGLVKTSCEKTLQ